MQKILWKYQFWSVAVQTGFLQFFVVFYWFQCSFFDLAILGNQLQLQLHKNMAKNQTRLDFKTLYSLRDIYDIS